MKLVQFNTDEAPLIRITLRSSTDDTAFEIYLNRLKQLLQESKEPILAIYDSRPVRYVNARQRNWHARWIKEHEELLREKCRGFAYVAPRTALRLILKGILMLRKPPVPYVVVDSMEAAEAWAQEMLAEQHPH